MRLGTVNSSAFRDRGAPIRNATNQAEGIHCISSGCTWIALLVVALWLTGCSGLPGVSSNTSSIPVPEATSSLQVEKEIPPLSRMEVITGSVNASAPECVRW